ncbi:MAG: anti-sigma factor domain-containing protein [Chloroflexota bacterium]
MQQTPCEAIRSLLEAYATGALETDEQALVEQHLVGCAACRRLADEYAQTVQVLPQVLAAVSPHRLPASLRARLLAAADESVDLTSRPFSAREGGRWPPPQSGDESLSLTEAGGSRAVTGVGSSAARRAPWWRSRSPGWVAAAAAVLVALSLAWSAQLGVALARERALRAEFASLVDQQEIVLEVVDSRQTVKRLLQPPDGAASSTAPYGKLYTRPDLPDVVAMAARLPQPPAGQAYHLWVIQDGETQLAGIFATNADGFGLLVFTAGQNGPVYDAASVTLQPIGGASPAGEVVLRWRT